MEYKVWRSKVTHSVAVMATHRMAQNTSVLALLVPQCSPMRHSLLRDWGERDG